MSAREFYELVVRMRAAQKLAGVTVKYEDIQLAFDYENKVDAEIDRVTRILNQTTFASKAHRESIKS